MIIGIIGTLIGLGVLCAGIYYLKTDKEDNSKKIYGTISAVSAVVTVLSVVVLISNLSL